MSTPSAPPPNTPSATRPRSHLGSRTCQPRPRCREALFIPKVREGSNLELRGEFYDLTNTPYFNNPNVTIGSATAGRITSVSNSSRQVQLALKFSF